MRPFRDQNIGFTISAAFGTTLFLMAVLVGLTLREIEETKQYRQMMTEEVIPAIDRAADLEYQMLRLSDAVRIYVLSGPNGRRPSFDDLDRTLRNDLAQLDHYPNPGTEATAVAVLRRNLTAFRSAVAETIERSENFGGVVADHYYRGNVEARLTPTVAAARAVQALKRERMKQIRERLVRRGDHLAGYLMLGFLAAAVVCILIARGTIETITVPARRLVAAARVLEHGEYDRAIGLGMADPITTVEPVNEIDRLRQSFVRMARGLQEREDRLLQQARSLEAANHRLAALQSITDVALSHLALDELLNQLVQRAVAATSARAGGVLLLDDTGRLRARAAQGITPDAVETLFNDPQAGWVSWLRSSSPSTERAVTTDNGRLPMARAPGSPTASLLALPLIAGNSAIGLAYAESGQPDAWGEEALALMHVFAERVARSIERARAFAALEEWNESLARRVAEQQEKLVRSERLASIGLVGAGIAHELRNPLGVINNSVYFLRQRLRGTDEKVARHTEIIEREVAHAARVIDSLVQFSQHAATTAHPVDLSAVVDASLTRVAPPAEVGLSLDLGADLVPVQADEQRLGQVIENLIRNAIQAMNGRGTLCIAAERRADEVTLQVHDSGPGIPPEHRERIFEPLFSTKPSGMGLGLALCRKMVEAWGGAITVSCPTEGGAIFAIRLLAAEATEGVEALGVGG